jgi:chromosome segregation ATPase
LSIIEEKYKRAKLQLEKAKNVNSQMKEKVKRASSNRRDMGRFRGGHSRVVVQDTGKHLVEVKRLESTIERLKSDLRYAEIQNVDLQSQVREIQRNEESRNLNKRFEAEKGKNMYLENENMQLRKQIRELNSKYKMFIDDKNRQTVSHFISKKSINTREIDDMRSFNSGLKKENKELKERMRIMNNELKMKSNISDAVSKKEVQLGNMRNDLASISEENNYLKNQIMKMEMEISSLKETLRHRDIELSQMGNGNDRMVSMYKKLYNDMKTECDIYMGKVQELSHQLQKMNDKHHLTYTKNVYQSKD